MYNFSLILILILFLFVAILYGFNRAISLLPFFIILFFIILFLGWFALNFFWLIPLFMLINYIKNKNQPKANRKTYYYYRNTGNAKDFEDFFRQSGFGGYQQSGYSSNGYNSSFSYTEDLTKYYQILGVTKSSTKDEIKKAYRDLVKKHHPDKFSNASSSEKEYHENKLKEINEAYEKIIKD